MFPRERRAEHRAPECSRNERPRAAIGLNKGEKKKKRPFAGVIEESLMTSNKEKER